MVGCLQYGRLGNALFQFAAALGYGYKNNQEVFIPENSPYRIYFPNLIAADINRINGFSHYKEVSHTYNEIPFFEMQLFA